MLKQLVRELRVVGLHVTSVSCDGASENRSLARELCNVAAKDLIPYERLLAAAEAAVRAARARLPPIVYESDADGAIAEDQLLLEAAAIAAALGDVMIGWRVEDSPTKEIIIFIKDAPHALKKLCNSFETRDGMLLDGQPVSLRMLHEVFEATHYTKDGRKGVGDTRLTVGHFKKTNLSRMNVALAAQVFSRTMYKLCTIVLKKRDPPLYARLAPMLGPTLQLLHDWNHLFDVMNSRCNHRELNIQNVNAPDHRHVMELLQTSAGMERWRQQCNAGGLGQGGKRLIKWVTRETGEDCIALGLGVAALAALHASTDNCLILRRLDQDKCEHHFANVRDLGAHGTVTVAVAKAAEMNSQHQRLAKVNKKSNARGSPAADVVAGKTFDGRLHKPTSADKIRDSLPMRH